jgi:hypothetical protein
MKKPKWIKIITIALTVILLSAVLFIIYNPSITKIRIIQQTSALRYQYLKYTCDFYYVFSNDWKNKANRYMVNGRLNQDGIEFKNGAYKAHIIALNRGYQSTSHYLKRFDSILKQCKPDDIPISAWKDRVKAYCLLGAIYSIQFDNDQKAVDMYNQCHPLVKKIGDEELTSAFYVIFTNYLPGYLSRQARDKIVKLIIDKNQRRIYEGSFQSNPDFDQKRADQWSRAYTNSQVIASGEKIGYFQRIESSDISCYWKFIDEAGVEFSIWQPPFIPLNPQAVADPNEIPKDMKLKVFWKRVVMEGEDTETDFITGYEKAE